MKLEIEATIPTTQYGNIKPKFTIEEDGDEQLALQRLNELWNVYGEKPLSLRQSGGVSVTSYTGEQLVYDDATHSYYDLDGNKLLSGSTYARNIVGEFDRKTILPKTAKAWKVDEESLGDMWSLAGDVSRHYGNAVHAALELAHKYNDEGTAISEHKGEDENYAWPNIPHLRDCVAAFVEQYGTDAQMEVLVSDVANKRAGRIDRLQILDEKNKVCRIGDFKTNYDLKKSKVTEYQHQLSFYAHILMAHGWKVEGLDLYHYADKWELVQLDVVDLQ